MGMRTAGAGLRTAAGSSGLALSFGQTRLGESTMGLEGLCSLQLQLTSLKIAVVSRIAIFLSFYCWSSEI